MYEITLTPEDYKPDSSALSQLRLQFLDICREDFEEGDGIGAFEAWMYARRWRIPVPEWVLRYFDQAARALVLQRKTPNVADAFGLVGEPSKLTRRQRREQERHRIEAVERYYELKSTNPKAKDRDLLKQVAKEKYDEARALRMVKGDRPSGNTIRQWRDKARKSQG